MIPEGLSIVPVLAGRFLLSKASDGFLSFIAWVSILGITLGVLALTVVTSVMNGFEGELGRVITGTNGDVLLYSRGDPIHNPDEMEDKIHAVLPNAQGITASFVAELMVAGKNGVSGAILEGVDSETLGLVTDIPKRITMGRLPVMDGEITLGYALAERLGATEGSDIRLIIPVTGGGKTGSNEPSMGTPKAIPAHVVGIVRLGMYEYDSKFIFASLGSVQKILEQPGRVTSFKIKLTPGSNTRKASDLLADAFSYPYRAKDWSQLNQHLFYAIQLEKTVIAIILTVIIIVAAFNVVSTLMMIIHDKTREIAILKAMGLRPGQGFRLFCFIGLGMGIVGTGTGVLLGLVVNWILEKTHWINLPADIYYIGFLPVVTRWTEVGMIAFVSMAISVLATLYPAWRVSRQSPLEGLRYE